MTGRKSATGLLTAVLVVTAFPLDFAGKLTVLRTKFLPGALHAIEGSGVSFRLLQILMLPGLGRCRWLTFALSYLCWTVLLVATLGSFLFGVGLDFFVGISPLTSGDSSAFHSAWLGCWWLSGTWTSSPG